MQRNEAEHNYLSRRNTVNTKDILTHSLQAMVFITFFVLTLAFSTTTYADETMQNGQELEAQVSSKMTQTQYDLNVASVKELASIKGIGLKKAQAIVAYRDQHGDFENIEAVTKVKGLGNKLLQKMKPFVVVTAPQNK